MKQEQYTIRDFKIDFPNDEACLEWLKNSRWHSGIHCVKCNKVTKHHHVSKRTSYACDECGNHVYPMAGTILEKSSTSLTTWFHAMFLMANTRCGISAKQLERETGVTYKTAWRMFRQIRSMLADDISLEGSSVEVDETYIGGRRRGKRGRGAEGKTPVIGLVQRKGRVKAIKTDKVDSATVMPMIRENVQPESTIYTDEYPIYNKVSQNGYKHETVNHAIKAWVIGDAHTNTIEGFWSLVKRGISGVYHAVDEKYVQSYVNEYSFRYNRRNGETAMFWNFLDRLAKV
jgi:transposase-like protein